MKPEKLAQLKVLIVPDKFKGTLSAADAAAAIACGWSKSRPQDHLKLLPMSDGGDGFGEIFSKLIGANVQKLRTIDAAHRSVVAPWWWAKRTRTAVIETARIIGLAMLPSKKFRPERLDTFGLGAVFRTAHRKGAKRCIVGIGGSATNDGGFGLAKGLGWRFFDANGQLIESWTKLDGLTKILTPGTGLEFEEVLVAVDVQNPLLGKKGASRIYGPQKGLQDFKHAEKCLRRLGHVWKKSFGRQLTILPGAGAAGGLGFGLMAFVGAKLVPGFRLFADHANLEKHIRWADVVVTGEGAIDASTVMGKGVGEIALKCRELGKRCIGVGGMADLAGGTRRGFDEIYALTDVVQVQRARANPAHWLEQVAKNAGAGWQQQRP